MPRHLDMSDPAVVRSEEFKTWCLAQGLSANSVSIMVNMMRRALAIAALRGAGAAVELRDVLQLIAQDRTPSMSTTLATPRAWRAYRKFRKEVANEDLPNLPRHAYTKGMDADDRAIAERIRELQKQGLTLACILDGRWSEGYLTWPGQVSSYTKGVWPGDKCPASMMEIGFMQATPPQKQGVSLKLSFSEPRDLAFIRAAVPRAFPDLTASGGVFNREVIEARRKADAVKAWKTFIFVKKSGRRLRERDAAELVTALEAEETREKFKTENAIGAKFMIVASLDGPRSVVSPVTATDVAKAILTDALVERAEAANLQLTAADIEAAVDATVPSPPAAAAESRETAKESVEKSAEKSDDERGEAAASGEAAGG